MANPDRSELQSAPEGTFQTLASVNRGILGSCRTRRFVSIGYLPDNFPVLQDHPRIASGEFGDGDMVVLIRISPRKALEQSYLLGITPKDQAALLVAKEGMWLSASDEHDMKQPPTVAELLKEIDTARRLQPLLKSVN